ncbi:glycoside hydrolase family 35 protein [Tessaracoccus sp.]|uniref:glycoside hydrolase family 35 protein n=1 Tax=Tessaracoccus sp. TaxID=1971211 RepID=UPI002606326C|nr:beta-galactosidase [Tessaracoccus sp.]
MILTPTAGGLLRDGRPHRIISGAMHYFRIRPEQWRDRLTKLAAMGCNTVETYVAWNFHAPTPDKALFTDDRDLGAFIDLAGELDLDVIVRPGPYICAEWEGGGFPGWLLADPRIAIRTSDPRYQDAVAAWFAQLLPVLVPRQAAHGGPVVAVQVENEYGSFGDDTAHLEWLRDLLLDAGVVELLVTSDGDAADWWSGGMVEGAMPTVNFGSRPEEAFERVRRDLPGTPLMCMEFWHGWFDHWGEEHHTRDAAEVAAALDTMLAAGASVNFYMGVGSTNFGLWNGANCQPFAATVTSYDYDAPIAEDGSLTAKFYAFREVIGRYHPLPPLDPALEAAPRCLPATALTRVGSAPFLNTVEGLPSATCARAAVFEQLGLARGALLLRRRVVLPEGNRILRFHGLRDRATVLVDGVLVGSAHRSDADPIVSLEAFAAGREVDLVVIVESEGRVNFGPDLGESKGLTVGAWLGWRFLNTWEVTPLPLDDLGELLADRGSAEGASSANAAPVCVTFAFDVDDPADGFLDVSALGRGLAYVNGFCLGRYSAVGPQETLYVPAPLLRQGRNTVTILEFERDAVEVTFTDAPRL